MGTEISWDGRATEKKGGGHQNEPVLHGSMKVSWDSGV